MSENCDARVVGFRVQAFAFVQYGDDGVEMLFDGIQYFREIDGPLLLQCQINRPRELGSIGHVIVTRAKRVVQVVGLFVCW